MRDWICSIMAVIFGLISGIGMVFCEYLFHINFSAWLAIGIGFVAGSIGIYVGKTMNKRAEFKKTGIKIKDLSPYDKELDPHSGKP